MGFNKRYINKDRIVDTFSRKGIYGVRDLFGLSNGLTGLGRVDVIITQDDFSDKVVTAYQEGRENDVAFDITDGVIDKMSLKK
jgi:hypothetical protein|tara:strand:- start:826 stop:1074 length:249 start_codon:yes stop_codon:yes gene_type:complete